MTVKIIDYLNQKFELRKYSVYFNIADGLLAEELLDHLDRATGVFKQVFNVQEDLGGSFYILKDSADFEKCTGQSAKMGETMRLDYIENAVLIAADSLESANIGHLAVKALGLLFFNAKVNEKEVKIRQWRTPSWLRDGFALQAEYKVRHDSREWLQNGWARLQETQKNGQLIKPSVLEKDIYLIPDPNRRQLALFQAFYMVRLLLGIYCDSFFTKYSTLMGALEDMEAETCFRQITSFDFDKFFSLFADWVQKTNAWSAME